jgi:hypothetical protein
MKMNTPVSFELAKLLKEKGFDIPCKEGWVNYLQLFTGETRMPDNESNLVIDRLGNSHLIERPTIAEVCMWLYEKHGIWIKVNWYNVKNNNIFWSYTIEKILQYPEPIDYTPQNTINSNSPTEAYEAAIEYTLNNLI